jgi:hypothetical protein
VSSDGSASASASASGSGNEDEDEADDAMAVDQLSLGAGLLKSFKTWLREQSKRKAEMVRGARHCQARLTALPPPTHICPFGPG